MAFIQFFQSLLVQLVSLLPAALVIRTVEDGRGIVVGHIAGQSQSCTSCDTPPIVSLFLPSGGQHGSSGGEVVDNELVGVLRRLTGNTQVEGVAQCGRLQVRNDGRTAEALEQAEVAGGAEEACLTFGPILLNVRQAIVLPHLHNDVSTLTGLLPRTLVHAVIEELENVLVGQYGERVGEIAKMVIVTIAGKLVGIGRQEIGQSNGPDVWSVVRLGAVAALTASLGIVVAEGGERTLIDIVQAQLH